MDCRSGHGKRQAMETCSWKEDGKQKMLNYFNFILFSLDLHFMQLAIQPIIRQQRNV